MFALHLSACHVVMLLLLEGLTIRPAFEHPELGPPPRAVTACPMPTEGSEDDPPTPVVTLRVRVPAQTAAGQELSYRITVENRSQAAAHHVLVRNPLPAHARFVRASPEPHARDPEIIWRLGTLAAGAVQHITLVLAPIGTGEVTNCARVQFEHGQCTTTTVARPILVVRKTGPAKAVLGDTLSYTVEVRNAGDATASGLKVIDQLAEGLKHASGRTALEWDLGELAPGQSRKVDYQVTAQATGSLRNRVTVRGDNAAAATQESVVTVGEPKLALTMTGPDRREVNLAATYRLTVRNVGTYPVEQVQVVNPVLAAFTFVSASAGGQVQEGQVRWLLGTLLPGEERTVEVELRVAAPGRFCNRAVASALRGLSASAEACTNFWGEPGLFLELVDLNDPVPLDGLTSYLITVRNQGHVTIGRIVITALLPDQVDLHRVSGPSEHQRDGTRIVFAPVTLPAGEEAQYRIEVIGRRPGDARFKVELTAEVLPTGPVREEESTTIYGDMTVSRRIRRSP